MRHRAPLFAALLLTAGSPLFAGPGRGFELSVVVDGCEVPQYEHAGRVYIEALRAKNFALRVTNPTSERIAVALSVDGLNVVDAKRTSALSATKWVLSPGETIEIPGWQVSGETSRKFFFTETRRSYARWIGDTRNVGLIEAVFFRENRRWPAPLTGGVEGGISGTAPGGIPGGVAGREGLEEPRATRDAAPPSSPETAPQPAKPSRDSSDRYAATGIGERTSFPVVWVDFDEDPKPVARAAVRYEFRRELVRLGVLPRHDDALAAREHARGFEPRYAPEPDLRRR